MRLFAPPRQSEREQRSKVAVIHPALDDLRPALGDEARELEQTRRNACRFIESQLDHIDACCVEPLHMGLGREKTCDGDFVSDPWPRRREPRQHPLGTAAPQTRRDIEDLSRPRAHAHLARQACSISTVHLRYRLPSGAMGSQEPCFWPKNVGCHQSTVPQGATKAPSAVSHTFPRSGSLMTELHTQADVFRLPIPKTGEAVYFDQGKPRDRAT